MNTITKTPKKNLFFTIVLGASVIQNVLLGRKTFLPWICKRCLLLVPKNPTLKGEAVDSDGGGLQESDMDAQQSQVQGKGGQVGL